MVCQIVQVGFNLQCDPCLRENWGSNWCGACGHVHVMWHVHACKYIWPQHPQMPSIILWYSYATHLIVAQLTHFCYACMVCKLLTQFVLLHLCPQRIDHFNVIIKQMQLQCTWVFLKQGMLLKMATIAHVFQTAIIGSMGCGNLQGAW